MKNILMNRVLWVVVVMQFIGLLTLGTLAIKHDMMQSDRDFIIVNLQEALDEVNSNHPVDPADHIRVVLERLDSMKR